MHTKGLNNFRKIIVMLIFLSGALPVFSQMDKDTLHLKEVNVLQTKKTAKNLQKIIAFDSFTLQQYKTSDLASILSTANGIFIKSYGPGLGTISFRGTGASQSKIFWNDIPVGSSAGGVFDFSLVPLFITDQVKVLYGNASLKQGMGGLGGSILLENNRVFGKNNIEASYTLGSFGTQKGLLGFNYGNAKISGATKLFFDKAENNYTFYNLAKFGYPLDTQHKAGSSMYGILQELAWKLSDKDIFSAGLWYQNYARDIAQAMTSINGHQWKNDSSTRIFIAHEHRFNKVIWTTKAAFTDEALHYRDYLSQINEKSKVDKLFLKSAADISFDKNKQMDMAVQYTKDRAISDGFTGVRIQERASFFMSYQQVIGSFQYQLMGREEIINHVSYAPVGNVVLLQDIIAKQVLQIKLGAGKNFNFPALYDLYWIPGGNPDLQPELAYSGEGGLISALYLLPNLNLNSELTFYWSDINNEIVWLPKNHGYYEAQNIKRVRTEGLEYREELKYIKGNNYYGATIAYSYTQALVSSTLNANDLSLGKQLIYVPKNTLYTSLKAAYKNWMLMGEYNFTGMRYTLADNTVSLPGYGLVNLSIYRTFLFKNYSFSVHGKILNIFDVSYQTIQWYPMPGRYMEIGIDFKL